MNTQNDKSAPSAHRNWWRKDPATARLLAWGGGFLLVALAAALII